MTNSDQTEPKQAKPPGWLGRQLARFEDRVRSRENKTGRIVGAIVAFLLADLAANVFQLKSANFIGASVLVGVALGESIEKRIRGGDKPIGLHLDAARDGRTEKSRSIPFQLKAVLGTAFCALLAFDIWYQVQSPNLCPNLEARIEEESKSLIWRNDITATAAIAEIHEVKLRCERVESGGGDDYEIGATATIWSTIDVRLVSASRNSRPLFLPVASATVLFDALSTSGDVIRSGTGVVTLTRSQTAADVSGTIHGLSAETIGRVTTVRASWLPNIK